MRRIADTYGSIDLWQGVLKRGLLTEQHTVYGAVLTMGPQGRLFARETPPPFPLPYVGGPNAAADRAFQMDAIALLEAEGYQVDHHVLKRAGAVGEAARRGQKTTDQIISTVMRVPEPHLRSLEARFPAAHRLSVHEKPGHPRLYATIGSGGIGLPRLRQLIRRHDQHIRMVWNCPLLVAVPEEGDLRGYLRQLDAEWSERMERVLREARRPPLPPVTIARLIVLPLPRSEQ